jgi:hypothetical protein
MSYRTGPKIVTDGLVLCLDAADRNSYAGSGSTWYDLSGQGNNATMVGTTYNASPPSNFTFFGNAATSYHYISNQSFIQDTSFSVSLWVRTTDSSRAGGSIGSEGRVPASTHDHNGNGTNNHTGWTIGTIWQGTYFDFRVYDGLGNATTASSTETNWYNTYLNKWTNIAGVFKSGDYVAFYQDGQLISQQSTTITTMSNHNDALYIGRRSDESQSPWLGNISSCSYFSRWLNDNEILQNYNALKGRFGL